MTLKKESNYVLKNFTLWSHDKTEKNKFLYIQNGKLLAVENSLDALGLGAETSYETFEGSGEMLLLPSGVDLQVHLRVPGQEAKETAETGLRAAFYGGYAAVLNMPNTSPTIDSSEALLLAQENCVEAEKKYGIRALQSAAVTIEQKGERLVHFESLAKAGAVAFTDDGVGVKQEAHFAEALKASAQFKIPILEHAEIYEHDGVLGKGPVQEKLSIPLYKREAEWKFVERDLRLLREAPSGARYHLLHMSTRESVELIRKAKEEGLSVTAEVSPHHLFFSSHDFQEENTAFKMNPPLHEPEDQLALQQALKSGVVDYVATDHAPHEAGAKSGDLKQLSFGTTGLQNALPVLMHFYHQGLIGAQRLVELFSYCPARFIGLDASYGSFQLNQPFRAVWVNEQADYEEFQASEIQSKSKNCVFTGSKLPKAICGHFIEDRVLIL